MVEITPTTNVAVVEITGESGRTVLKITAGETVALAWRETEYTTTERAMTETIGVLESPGVYVAAVVAITAGESVAVVVNVTVYRTAEVVAEDGMTV